MSAESALERPLPSNLDAERSILGAILLDNNALNAAIEALKPDDFFIPRQARSYRHVAVVRNEKIVGFSASIAAFSHCVEEDSPKDRTLRIEITGERTFECDSADIGTIKPFGICSLFLRYRYHGYGGKQVKICFSADNPEPSCERQCARNASARQLECL